jgi:hypothetical protein
VPAGRCRYGTRDISITGRQQQESKTSGLVLTNNCIEIAEVRYDIAWMRYLRDSFSPEGLEPTSYGGSLPQPGTHAHPNAQEWVLPRLIEPDYVALTCREVLSYLSRSVESTHVSTFEHV